MSEPLELKHVQDCDENAALEAACKCRLCEAEPNFLVYLQFGSSVDKAARLQIEQYVKRALRSSTKQRYADTQRNNRKRRRKDSDDDDNYPDGCGGVTSSCRTSRRLGVHNGGDAASGSEAASLGSVLVIYGQDTGFDLDTTKDSGIDQEGPRYERGTNLVVGVPLDSVQALGNPCFNCSSLGHELRGCPRPLDREVIEANRSAFKEKGQEQFNSRLHLVAEERKRVEETRQRIRPGQPLSRELREALGLERDDDVPEYVKSIYYHGYPPAYLGSMPDQDPLLARARPATPVPSTPMLVVYNEYVDYVDESRTGVDDASTSAITLNTANGHDVGSRSSDGDGALSEPEDGALSEGELDGESDKLGAESSRAEESHRNIPLVKYPGLDFADFDFASSSRPGRPLHPHTPHRSKIRGEDEYQYYDEPQASYHQGEKNDFDDSFAGLLDTYYRSSRQPADKNPHWQYGANVQPCHSQLSRHDAHFHNSASNSPAQEMQPAVSAGEYQDNVNVDLEDGECDMEESD
ncbi:hypothetical protein GGI20_003636 [Coemansia sp. BCRC 34301]|nr:hypothetical protein GGI20_003636 [Coemansia sp. BCRC 34301]